ncbi:hypothetical protein TNCV_4857331 [Trichonephila clavipes]|uniref:Uncharacterized protein n=1 Tax=Trichonephila clavipes TaxID=2585209 RepID=A0A8X6REM7_TRICX|nr:hypothetical protein TNCV_4857331 [Trichonephila clavipes]
MAAVDFLHHDIECMTWAGLETATLGKEDQQQTNRTTQPAFAHTLRNVFSNAKDDFLSDDNCQIICGLRVIINFVL